LLTGGAVAMKAFRGLLLAAVAGGLASGAANAQERPAGPYVAVFGGFGWPVGFVTSFTKNVDPNLGDRFQYVTELDNGALVGAAIGFNLVPGAIRTEIEAGRMMFNANAYYGITENGIDPPLVGEGVDGFVRVATVMVNTWVTINAGTVETYFGGGVGAGLLTTDLCTSNLGCQFSGTTLTFAYQIGGGVIFPLGPRVSMDLGYRFRGTIGGRLISDVNDFDAAADGLGVHVGLLGFTFGY
jgi:opacity protein-like surface antigen